MKILVAIDGSPASSVVLESLSRVSQDVNDKIEVVTVAENLPGLYYSERDQIEDARDVLTQAVQTVESTITGRRISGSILVGTPDLAILKQAELTGCDLLLLGSHGKNFISRFLLGSVSRSVLQHATCPVQVVKTGYHRSRPSNRYKVLVATNESLESDVAFDALLTMKWPAETEFLCVTVLPYEASDAVHYCDAKIWLKSCVFQLNKKLSPVAASYKIVRGNPVKSIIQEADGWAADLIVLGSRCPRWMDKIAYADVSAAVATESMCSVRISPMRVGALI